MAKPTEVLGLGPKTRLSAAAPSVLKSRLADVRAHARDVARGAQVAPVHDLRVATRRLRAALQLFGAPRKESDRVKRLQDALGAVRDAQLHDQFLGGELPARRRKLSTVLRHFLREARQLERLWRGQASLEPRGRLGGQRLRADLRKRLRAIDRLVAAAAEKMDARHAHRLRIAVKKLRYRAELVQQALPQAIDALLEAITPLQDTLGELHDLDVRLGLDPSGDLRERKALAARLLAELQRWSAGRAGRAFQRMLR